MKQLFNFSIVILAILTASFSQAATKQEVLELAISRINQISINFIAVPGSGNDNYYFNSGKDAEGYFFSEYVDPNDGLVKLQNIEVGGYTVTWEAYPSEGKMSFKPYTQDIVISTDKTAVLKQPNFELKDKQQYGVTVPVPDGQHDRFSIVSCDEQTLIANVNYPSINVNDNSVYLAFEADYNVECIKVVTNNYSGPNTISGAIEISPLEVYDWNWQPNPDLAWEEIDTGAEYGNVVLEGPPTFSVDGKIAGDEISSVSLRTDIKSSIVVAGAEDVPILDISFEAGNTPYMVTELVIATHSGNTFISPIAKANVSKVSTKYYYDHQTTVATDIPNNGISALSLLTAIPENANKTISIYADFNDNSDVVNSGDKVYFELVSYKYIDQNNIEREVEVNLISKAKKVVYFNLPSVTTKAGKTASLKNSNNEVMEIAFTADETPYSDIGINSLSVRVDLFDAGNNNGLLSLISVELLDEYGELIATATSNVIDREQIYTFSTEGKINIPSGTTENYTVNVNLSGIGVDDSCRVTLIPNNFSWSDGEKQNITTNTDLIQSLDGHIEIEK